MALDATVGGESSNSYVTNAEAGLFYADRPQSADWDALGSAQDGWLILATDRLEQEKYQGERTDDDQALSFPRVDVVVDGIEVDNDVIPPEIKRAQMKYALILSGEDNPLANTGLEGFRRLKVDVIDMEPVEGYKAGNLPFDVQREIQPLLAGGSGHQFRVFRG